MTPHMPSTNWKTISNTGLLMDVGNVTTVGSYAEQLRLHITREECSTVLDYVAEQKLVLINTDVVEDAINSSFDDRFIEP